MVFKPTGDGATKIYRSTVRKIKLPVLCAPKVLAGRHQACRVARYYDRQPRAMRLRPDGRHRALSMRMPLTVVAVPSFGLRARQKGGTGHWFRRKILELTGPHPSWM